MLQYNYINADPGAGKTDWAIKQSIRWTQLGHPVMFVVPTTVLCDEIQQRSQHRIEAIHSKNRNASVSLEIAEIMVIVAKTHTPRAIVVTDAAFQLIPYLTDPGNWIIIRDEPKEPLMITELRCPDSRDLILTEFIATRAIANSNLFVAGAPKTSQYSLTDTEDSILGEITRLKQLLQNNKFEILIDQLALDNDIFRYSVYQKPELYAEWGEVYFMGANFQDTFIYHMWTQAGVVWREKPVSLPRLPSDRLRIYYRFNLAAAGWSKSRRNRPFGRGTYFTEYQRWIQQELPDNDFVYVVNNEYGSDPFGGTRMPAECHGLNRFRSFHRVVLGASYLVNQTYEPFYQYYGASTTDARGMRGTQYYVQQITRTDIRNYAGTDTVHAYVPTLREALDLLRYFPDAHVIGLEESTPRFGQLLPCGYPVDNFQADLTDLTAIAPSITWGARPNDINVNSEPLEKPRLNAIAHVSSKNQGSYYNI